MIIERYKKLMDRDVLSTEEALMLHALELEIRLAEANNIESLMRTCSSLTAALALLRMHIKRLTR